jgi:hypothetical protein
MTTVDRLIMMFPCGNMIEIKELRVATERAAPLRAGARVTGSPVEMAAEVGFVR